MNDAMIQGREEVLNYFDELAPTNFYSVWKGRNIIFSNNEDDPAKAKDLLDRNISVWERNQNRDILILKFHPKQEKTFISDKTPVIQSLSFRSIEYSPMDNRPVPGTQGLYAMDARKILEQQNIILSKLSAMEVDPNEVEEEEDETSKTIGHIERALDHPVVMGLINKFLGSSFTPQAPVATALGFIPESEKEASMTKSLQTLIDKDPLIVEHFKQLADIAEKDPKKFQQLLGMFSIL
jgi:hypothetical protein